MQRIVSVLQIIEQESDIDNPKWHQFHAAIGVIHFIYVHNFKPSLEKRIPIM